MSPEGYYAMLEESYRKNWNKFTKDLHTLGVERRIGRLDADNINRAAKADNGHWDVRCARAGIGVLGVWYTTHDEASEIDTVIQYEFQWRFGSGEGERRWAKSVITHHSKGSEGLTGMAACMVVYHAVQQQRKMLENKE